MIDQKNEISHRSLQAAFEQLGDRPDLLPTVFRRAGQLGAGRLATGAPAEGVASLQRAARVAALMFVHARHPDETTSIELDAECRVELAGEIDASLVTAPDWIEGMWCALAVGDAFAQEWLATIPVRELRAEGVEHARYALAVAEFLRSLVTRDGAHGRWLGDAIEQSDDDADRALAATREWVDSVEFPALRAAYHALDRDAPGFNRALVELLEAHRRHWSAPALALAVDGLLSLRACALCRLAAGLGLGVTVESTYIPPAVWQAETPQRLRCPYCVGPIAPEAGACALCGREQHDALLETSAGGARPACRACHFPLHALAVVCPQCRSPRRRR